MALVKLSLFIPGFYILPIINAPLKSILNFKLFSYLHLVFIEKDFSCCTGFNSEMIPDFNPAQGIVTEHGGALGSFVADDQVMENHRGFSPINDNL